jgi:hypothetical protein
VASSTESLQVALVIEAIGIAMLSDPDASRDNVIHFCGEDSDTSVRIHAQLARLTHDVSGEHEGADAVPADTVIEFPEWIVASTIQIVGSLVITCYVHVIRAVATRA